MGGRWGGCSTPTLSVTLTACCMSYSLPGSIETFLLKKAKEKPEDFNKFYLVAASFRDEGNHTTVTALFNNQAYHSPALAMTMVDNFLFKLLSGAGASIRTSNYPQPQSEMEISENVLYQWVHPPSSLTQSICLFITHFFLHLLFITNCSCGDGNSRQFHLHWYLSPHRGPKGHYLVVNLLFGVAFLSSSFSILIVRERRIKAKHIQFVSGIYLVAYWLSALLWDLISFLVPTLLMVVSAGSRWGAPHHRRWQGMLP